MDSSCRAGVLATVQVVLLLGGSRIKMTNALSLTCSWKHTACYSRERSCCPKTLVSLATYLLSGDEPQAQHSNCVLQGLEVTILATTTFFLLKMFFSVLFFLCENENECLPCVRLAHAVEEITENPEGLG